MTKTHDDLRIEQHTTEKWWNHAGLMIQEIGLTGTLELLIIYCRQKQCTAQTLTTSLTWRWRAEALKTTLTIIRDGTHLNKPHNPPI